MDKYSVSMVDNGVWIVIDNDGDGLEYCICSDFEEGVQDAEKRANIICNLLNAQEKAKFVVLDESEDYGKQVLGVCLNELHWEQEYDGINAWDDLSDAIDEKNELIGRDAAGDWEVFAVMPVQHEIKSVLVDFFGEE